MQLRLVFQLLRQNQLVVNKKKCNFVKGKVEYLGHVVQQRGWQPSQDRSYAEMASSQGHKGIEWFFGPHGLLPEICEELWSARLLAKRLTDLQKERQLSLVFGNTSLQDTPGNHDFCSSLST